MTYIVPTLEQAALLASHPEGYDRAITYVASWLTEKRLDVDSGFKRITAAIEQQRRFNATPPVRLSVSQRHDASEYRALTGR